MMYEQHFGLDRAPFRITPDPGFFYPGGNRGAVLEALVYAVSRGEGIVKVVGEVGSGKTMLCRMLERELPANCEIVYLANPRLSPDEILHAIAFELGIDCATDEPKLRVLHALQAFLLEKHAANVHVIVFVEEAQGMPVETLEEIRLLSNLETTRDKLLQIVLFGQPELDETLDRHEIRQLRERITHAFELAPLGSEEIRDYVNTRLRASAYRGNGLFEPGALRELERHSGGLLRRINVLADKSLLAAFAAGDTSVRAPHVRRAVDDTEFGRGGSAGEAHGRPGLRAGVALAVVVALLAVGSLLLRQEDFPGSDAGGPVQPAAPPDRAGAAAPETPPRPDAGGIRAQAADPAPAPATQGGFDDNRRVWPRVEPATGLVTLEHLRPTAGAGAGAGGAGTPSPGAATVAGSESK